MREIRKLIAVGRPLVYLDETWLIAHHSVGWKWYDDSGDVDTVFPAEAPSGKGKRLNVLHAGYAGGFLPNCSLVFVCNTKFHDYHDEMNGTHFAEWFEKQLLPNLPPNAVIVMDNAPYHSLKTAKSTAPTSATRKADMKKWLLERKIAFTEDMLKPELYELVKANKPPPEYVCDKLALNRGFQVVRLPPYHCIFN